MKIVYTFFYKYILILSFNGGVIIKKSVILVTFLMLVALFGCSKQASTPANQTQPTTSPLATASSVTTAKGDAKTFDASELAKYNGQNGNPAYIAINGKVYDVTNAKDWRNGKHKGASAGADLTKEMTNSPHGLSVLEGIPIVGVYSN